MYVDYKFWYIKRDDDDFITEAAIRVYTGDYEMVDGEETYVRNEKLQSNDLQPIGGEAGLDGGGGDVVIFTSDDFGSIKEDSELTSFLNDKLKSLEDYTRIPEQM